MDEESRLGLEEFMTGEEAAEVGRIFARAKERREEKEAEKAAALCPCGFAMNGCGRNPVKAAGEARKLLEELCGLCRKYGCCGEQDEDLPFQ